MIIRFLKKIYHTLPLPLRYHLSSMLWWVSYIIKRLVNTFYPTVTLITPASGSQQSLSFGYIGNIHQGTRFYLSEKLAGKDFNTKNLGRRWAWAASGILRKNHPDCVLILDETPFGRRGCGHGEKSFRLPCWVDMQLDLPGPIDQNANDQLKKTLRKIAENRLASVVSNDPEDFDHFYHNLYRPYIKSRYTGSALIGEYAKLKKQFDRGGLILVKQDSRILSGGLFDIYHNLFRFRVIGVKDNNQSCIQQGVIGALYYYLLIEMKKRGFSSIHLGGTRPFLSNGVTNYKLSWGARLIEKNRNSCLSLILLQDTADLRQFLINNPFIHCKNKHLHCAVFFLRKSDYTGRRRRKIEDGSRCPGAKGTDVTFLE